VDLRDVARHARAFLGRVVSYPATEAGIRQFLDIGSGLPTADNTHEVAQRVAPQSRVVYVDNDPLVLAHARALLTSSPQGSCGCIHADLHEPDTILTEAARTLDFARPVALIMLGIRGHIPDEEHPKEIVARLVQALAPGSY
jgi:O-methyltransferase involved in polyketide biosynthesis